MTTTRLTLSTASAEETESVGEAWGRVLEPGDVLLLIGDLGAGKTTLVRGLARGLGVSAQVKSPTFAIHLQYPARWTLHHLDLYRLHDPRELDELGWEDWFGREGVCVVEWGDRLGDLTPSFAVSVTLSDGNTDERVLEIKGPAEVVARLTRAGGDG